MQTNYEPWEEPPLYDNRRGPGIDYMMRVGKKNMNLPHMYSVSVIVYVLVLKHHTMFTLYRQHMLKAEKEVNA